LAHEGALRDPAAGAARGAAGANLAGSSFGRRAQDGFFFWMDPEEGLDLLEEEEEEASFDRIHGSLSSKERRRGLSALGLWEATLRAGSTGVGVA